MRRAKILALLRRGLAPSEVAAQLHVPLAEVEGLARGLAVRVDELPGQPAAPPVVREAPSRRVPSSDVRLEALERQVADGQKAVARLTAVLELKHGEQRWRDGRISDLEAKVSRLQEQLDALTLFPGSPPRAPVAKAAPIHGGDSGKTLNLKRPTESDLEVGGLVYPEVLPPLPSTRAECPTARPCPHVRCKHHLYLEVTDAGSVQFNQPDREVWDMEESCALDVAQRGGETLEVVGCLLGVTRERVRQVEAKALVVLRRRCAMVDNELGVGAPR